MPPKIRLARRRYTNGRAVGRRTYSTAKGRAVIARRPRMTLFRNPTKTFSHGKIISDRYFCKLPYTELKTQAYSGTLNAYQFRTNSVQDPNYTGTGHQPMGHDELAQLYNKYRVIGCKYECIFSNTNPAYQGEAVLQFRPNSVLSATFEDAMEGGSNRQYAVLGAEGSGPVVIKGYTSVPRVYGVTKEQFRTNDQFAANIGSNPTINTFMNIYVQNQATATALTIAVRVNLVYYVEFYERKVLAQS